MKLKTRLLFSLLLFGLLFIACSEQKIAENELFSSDRNLISHAEGFRVFEIENGYRLQFMNTWIADEILTDFYLYPDTLKLPKEQENKNIIRTPLRSIITLSSTQWSPLNRLGEMDIVKGISEASYVVDSIMKNRLLSGKTIEVATESSFNVERMIQLDVDAILYSAYPSGIPEQLLKVPTTHIPWTDYYEQHPLGRAEWLRLMGFLTGKSALADAWFDSIVMRYEKLQNLAKNAESKPTVFSDKPFGGQWYIPGGKSYVATLFNDSGADYLWKDNDSKASFPVDPEIIITKAQNADYWRIAQYASTENYSYKNLISENEIYETFRAVKEKQVLFCDISKTAYFEKAQYEPEIVLSDFIYCFHSELLKEHIPVYFKCLK